MDAERGTPDASLAEARRALLEFTLRQRRAARVGQDRIEPIPRTGLLPVTEQQRYLWFLHQLAPGLPTYNVPAPLRLRGALDRAALQRALHGLVSRHESLRTRFGEEHGVPYQIIDEPPAEVPIRTVDLSGLPEAEREARVRELAEQELRAPFDLAAGPVLRCWLARLAEHDHFLLLTAHHIVTDGWSVGIAVTELAALYEDAAARLAPVGVQPVDFAAWQQRRLASEAGRDELGYWRQRLTGLQPLEFPADRPRRPVPTLAGATASRPLPAGLMQAARAMMVEARVSMLVVLSAAFYLVLQRYCEQDDLAFGSVFSGRTRGELESMIGFFANSLVLRTDLSGDPTVRELLARTNDTVLDASAHQDVPFGTVVGELNPDRVAGSNPLFQLSFTLLTGEIVGRYRFGELAVEQVPLDLGTSRFDLAFQVSVGQSGGTAWVEYSTELFDRDRMDRLLGHYETALTELVAGPDRRLSELDIVPADERRRLLIEWNGEPVDHGTGDALLHELVATQAGRAPDQPAVAFEGSRLSYAELDAGANRLARLLQDQHGAGPEQVVGVLLDRGPALPLAQLGIGKAGAAWLPLDGGHPAARIAFQLADAGARVVLTEPSLARLLPPGVAAVVLDDELRARLGRLPATPPPCAALPESPAYVIYTSGSTGTPKGVVVPHRAAVNFVGSAQRLFALTPDDRVLQFANPAFDVSVFDFYAALGTGATLVAAPREVLHDVDRLAELLRRERVSVADLPPAVLGLLEPDNLPDLRALFVGLEAFPAELVNRWRTPSREFHNGYGPTEATVACVDYACPPRPLTAPPPIGRPMPNHRAYVLDVAGHLAPIGVPGELHVAGAGLARGYTGRAAATAERFRPCPFGAPGERMYATGDIVRWNRNGQLEFLGRADRQVKIRGLRIELGEIEHALLGLPEVRQAVVLVESATGGPRLDAYLVPRAGSRLDEAGLRSRLADQLPLHLVPATFTELDALPLTASGKLDRARLPVPNLPAGRPRVAPATETERALAEIWHQLLDVELDAIGQRDSFFDLGGSSLQVTRLISRIRDAFYLTLEPRQLFTHPVLAELAALIDEQLLAELDEGELAELQDRIAGLSEAEIDRLLAEGAG